MSDLFSGEPLARYRTGPRNKTSIWKPSGRSELTNATTTPPSAPRPRGLTPTHSRTRGATTITAQQQHPRMCCAHTQHIQTKIQIWNTANGIAEARINAASLLGLRLKVRFVFRGVFLPWAAALTVMRFLKQFSSKHWSLPCCRRKEAKHFFLNSWSIWESPWAEYN